MKKATLSFRTRCGLLLAVMTIITGSYLGFCAQIEKDNEAARAEYAKVLAALKAALPANDANLQKLVALQAAREKALADQVARLQAAAEQVRGKLEQNLKSAEKYEKEIAQLLKEKDDIEAKLQVAIRDAELKLKKLEEKIPQIDLLAYEKPKGKITAVDETQKFVFLNLGTADFVRQGLTFSVFGEGEYKANAERKACIMVAEITGEHRCRARVTEIKNALRQPIVAGDLLYNPAWSPGFREHVAIVGLIDLGGDGRDRTADFVKMPEQEGVIVDVWLDLKELTLKGKLKAINLQTNFLIVGDLPELDGAGPAAQERNLAVHQQAHQLREQAIQHGVSVVNARRYLAVAGIQVSMPAAPAAEKKK